MKFTIQTRKPTNVRGRTYVVSAVLNNGWMPSNQSDWVRKGDFLSSGTVVDLQEDKKEYEANFQLSCYGELTLNTCVHWRK